MGSHIPASPLGQVVKPDMAAGGLSHPSISAGAGSQARYGGRWALTSLHLCWGRKSSLIWLQAGSHIPASLLGQVVKPNMVAGGLSHPCISAGAGIVKPDMVAGGLSHPCISAGAGIVKPNMAAGGLSHPCISAGAGIVKPDMAAGGLSHPCISAVAGSQARYGGRRALNSLHICRGR